MGWPVDMVARNVVQKPLLVGRDALDNRSMRDLRRPLERGVIREGSERDEEAVLELLRHLMALVSLKQKGKSRPKVRAVVGVPAEAFRVRRQRLRGAMDGLADSVMLVSEPFAVAYGLEALLHAMIVDIGAGTTDLCIMQGRYPAEEDQRTIPDAGDAIDERLAKVIRERHPKAQFSIHMIREWAAATVVKDPIFAGSDGGLAIARRDQRGLGQAVALTTLERRRETAAPSGTAVVVETTAYAVSDASRAIHSMLLTPGPESAPGLVNQVSASTWRARAWSLALKGGTGGRR